MRNFNLTEEIRQKQSTAEKAALVFDLISRALYTSLFPTQDPKQG